MTNEGASIQKGEKEKETTAATHMSCNMLKYTSKYFILLEFPTMRAE